MAPTAMAAVARGAAASGTSEGSPEGAGTDSLTEELGEELSGLRTLKRRMVSTVDKMMNSNARREQLRTCQ